MQNLSRKVHRYLISFEYKGNVFSGFQKQCAHNQPKSLTVQGAIENALCLYTNGRVHRIFGSSRTDAGVHALHNTAHLEIPAELLTSTKICINKSSGGSDSSSDSDKSSKEENKQQEKDILVQLSLSLIDFYRNELSPFMPKSCRFIPSCSNYAFEAYTKYGAAKGFILTAWRIARCNPFGGRGYDPPRWPPSFTRGVDGE